MKLTKTRLKQLIKEIALEDREDLLDQLEDNMNKISELILNLSAFEINNLRNELERDYGGAYPHLDHRLAARRKKKRK